MINRAAQNIPQYVKLFTKNLQCSSAQKELINVPSEEFVSNRQALKKNVWRNLDPTGLVHINQTQKSQTTHLSNAEQLIREIPVIKVASDVVRCMVWKM